MLLLDMLERAGAHGLAYLAEARPEVMFPGNYGPKVADHVLEECGGAQVLVEQYLDFVVDRVFRESLLVHAERAPQIRYSLDRSRYGRMHFAASVPPADGQHGSISHVRGIFRRAARRCSPTIRHQGGIGCAHRQLAVDAVTPGVVDTVTHGFVSAGFIRARTSASASTI